LGKLEKSFEESGELIEKIGKELGENKKKGMMKEEV
jgi:hypothetical protein